MVNNGQKWFKKPRTLKKNTKKKLETLKPSQKPGKSTVYQFGEQNE